jgi:3',5'-cyclic AMP phosphodiesterase CpdA
MLWILRNLALGSLSATKREYSRRFPVRTNRVVNVIQVSDIHLGSREADLRLPRLQQHLVSLTAHLSESSDVLIAVTGDLMDSPGRAHLDRVRAFVQFLSTLPTPPPILLLGNHDVRRGGYLDEDLRAALQLPMNAAASGVSWFDDLGVGMISVNSVVEGNLATGRVGERQLIDLANTLDQRRDRDQFTLIGAIHHHPLPVERPDWYAAPFYERILGSTFERTDCLDDAEHFLAFVREQGVAAVLHGHKHIPRIATVPGTEVPVIGCGSSVGKISTRDGTPYLSVNVVTVDRANRRVAARLMASRAAGGRFSAAGEHEAVLVAPL